MTEFLRRNRILLAVSFLLVVSAGLVLRSETRPARDEALGRALLEVTTPVQGLSAAVLQALAGGWASIGDLFAARDEVVALRARVHELQREIVAQAELELENDRLRRLLDFRATLTEDVITARVIARDPSGLSQTLTVDRGENDGVVKGAAVLVSEGIVGQVFASSRHAARVLLISDHNSGVDGIVQRSRARGIVEGTTAGGLGLKFLKRTEDVAVGDLVITSGLDGIFPKGLPVGRVVGVDKQGQGLFQYAEVTPSVEVERLEEVLVTRRQSVPPPEG